jgi:DsbC/DsbD-like thiol-disulfide interchange protein
MRCGSQFRFGVMLAALALFGAACWGQAAQTPSHARLALLVDGVTAPKALVLPERGKPIWVGVLFRLDPGWHVYWQNAGDSGEPPKVKWELPAGFHAGEIRWPTPIRLGSGSVIDYGYEGQVLLMAPIEAESGAIGQSVGSFAADVRYVVCREVCIPGKGHVTMEESAANPDAGAARLFAETRAALPRKMPAGWSAGATQDKTSVILTVKTGGVVKSATFFPLDAGVIENSAAQKVEPVASGFRLRLKKSEQLLKPAENLNGLIVVAPGKSFEIAAVVNGE